MVPRRTTEDWTFKTAVFATKLYRGLSLGAINVCQPMAITPLALNYGLSGKEISQIARAAGLDGQARLEAWQCWDMIQIWQAWVTDRFGSLTSVRHRSPPDDPPDLELIFEKQTVGMEHSRLQPKHLGQARALMEKSGAGGFIPSISSPPADLAEMIDIIVGVKIPMSSTTDDWVAIFDLLAITLRKKMRGMPSGGIIGIVHDLVVSDAKKRALAEVAQNIVNRNEFADLGNYTLILLDRWNVHQFHSSLVRRNEKVLEQTGNPPPLSAEDQKLLSEMEAATKNLDVTED